MNHECTNWVDHQKIKGKGAEFFIYSPQSGKKIGVSHHSNVEDLNAAVKSSSRAFLQWKKVPIKERCQVLFQFRQVLLRDLDMISERISSESGKTVAEGRAGLMKGIEVLEFALSLQNRDEGGKLEVSRGVNCEYRREPLGVVAAITPFNFPAMVPMWMIPISIAVGNALIWKPSDKTPLTSMLIAESLREAGLPEGVLNIIQGGKDTVESILDHPGIQAVGFVGSTPIAKAVYQRGSHSGKRVLALGGAKNSIILMPDADPEMASRGITDSFTGCAGQRCMAASLLLHVGQSDAILREVVEKARSIRLGADMGAIISRESLQRIREGISKAEKEGAKIILDGRTAKAPAGFEEGNWIGPTILDHVKPESSVACDELFGPVLSVIRCENLSEAIRIENSSFYGNAASIFTSSGSAADRVMQEAKAGMIGVNVGVPVPREPFSFGGTGNSKFGVGDITGPTSVNFWSTIKKITTKWNLHSDQNWMS